MSESIYIIEFRIVRTHSGRHIARRTRSREKGAKGRCKNWHENYSISLSIRIQFMVAQRIGCAKLFSRRVTSGTHVRAFAPATAQVNCSRIFAPFDCFAFICFTRSSGISALCARVIPFERYTVCICILDVYPNWECLCVCAREC